MHIFVSLPCVKFWQKCFQKFWVTVFFIVGLVTCFWPLTAIYECTVTCSYAFVFMSLHCLGTAGWVTGGHPAWIISCQQSEKIFLWETQSDVEWSPENRPLNKNSQVVLVMAAVVFTCTVFSVFITYYHPDTLNWTVGSRMRWSWNLMMPLVNIVHLLMVCVASQWLLFRVPLPGSWM